MGEGTVAARANVLTARRVAEDELDGFEASARAAADVPAQIRRKPLQAAGLAAGVGFLAVGGPAKLFRGVKHVVLGPSEPLPEAMLPADIEKAVRKLGTDGDRVRGTLEREFAKYLEKTQKERRDRDLGGVLALLLTSVAKPAAQRYGRRLAEQVADPDAPGVQAQLAKIRARRSASTE